MKRENGNGNLKSITVKKGKGEDEEIFQIETDAFIPLFGLSPKLGPIANWGLEIEKNASYASYL